MKPALRRTLTALSTGAALFGALRAVIGVTPVATASQTPRLKAALRAQQLAGDKLQAAMGDVHRQDRQARAEVSALQASIRQTRRDLAAAAASRAFAPVVHATTGASGGDGSGGGDDGGGDD